MATTVQNTQQTDPRADRVLATLAEALTTLSDIRHERVIMTAAVLAARHELTPDEAVEMASFDCSGEVAKAAWAEAVRLLEQAAEVSE